MIIKVISNLKYQCRRIALRSQRATLVDEPHFTILSDNCIAGALYKELGLKFQSPTIGLFFCGGDFVKFCSNMEFYLQCELHSLNISRWLGQCNYPIAELGDIEIHFLHYDNFDDAKKSWNRRKLRINKERCYLIMTDRDFSNYSDIKAFDELPFKNKIVYSSRNYFGIDSLVYCEKYKNNSTVGVIASYLEFLDYFDVLKWISNK